ncbi:hypothetical protein [Nostoc sp. CALU 546]|uniref:hypothetical protein n=1 Tax=Nostoc sp. CALU 546 TaxID=1867241 RepID=UPI003B671978
MISSLGILRLILHCNGRDYKSELFAILIITSEVKAETSTIVVSQLSDAAEPQLVENAEDVAQPMENFLGSDDILNSLKTKRIG